MPRLKRREILDQFCQRFRVTNAIALTVIHTKVDQVLHDLFVFDKFRHRYFAKLLRQIIDGANHHSVHLIHVDISHEKAINFHDIYRKFLQVTKRRQARPKIVQRNHTAERFGSGEKVDGLI